MKLSLASRWWQPCLVFLSAFLTAATEAMAVEPTLVVTASTAIRGLEPVRGQRHVGLVPLADGRVLALYTVGYAEHCSLLGTCKQHSEVWHLVFDQRGLLVKPRQTWPELDAKPSLNSGSLIAGQGSSYLDGRSAVFGLGHSSHNSGGGYFVRINGEGDVLWRAGGEGSYPGRNVCVLGENVATPALWVDPVTHGYLWYERGAKLTATVNLGGYGYNYHGVWEMVCGASAALKSDFALLVRKEPRSHVGFSLYRAPGKQWNVVGDEVRLPVSPLPSAKYLASGGVAVGDDRGVVLYRDSVSADGRKNLYFARFRITPTGVVLIDKSPRPMPDSLALEGLDGSVLYGGRSLFHIALYQAGNSAAGQPVNRRQLIRFYGLDFESGRLTEIAAPYQDQNWSGKPPIDYYANNPNEDSFSMARSCDGNLYVGGAVDGGKGPTVLKIFSIPVGSPTCR